MSEPTQRNFSFLKSIKVLFVGLLLVLSFVGAIFSTVEPLPQTNESSSTSQEEGEEFPEPPSEPGRLPERYAREEIFWKRDE